MSNPHLSAGLEHLGPSLADAAVVAVAVHGRGQSPQYMIENLVERVAVDDVAWLLPAAADNSWYPCSFLAPVEDNQPQLDHALAVLGGVQHGLDGFDPARVVWAGFSQGACLVSEYLSRNPHRWAGVLAFTGGLLGPPGTELTVAGPLDGMPVYFGVPDHDEWVPEFRVHETADAFRAAGADVTVEVFPDCPHIICETEIEQARQLIDGIRGAAP